MSARGIITRLAGDIRGAAAIEFALLGPALLVMLFGVLQVGLGLQSYNAMRNLSADVARYAMVQYQTGNELSNSQLRTFARNHAQGAPYMMDPDRLEVLIDDAETQRVAGARELNIEVSYTITSMLEFAGIPDITLDFNRPIFLLQEDEEA